MVIDQYQVQQSNHIEQHRTLYSNTIVHYTASNTIVHYTIVPERKLLSPTVQDSYETIVYMGKHQK